VFVWGRGNAEVKRAKGRGADRGKKPMRGRRMSGKKRCIRRECNAVRAKRKQRIKLPTSKIQTSTENSEDIRNLMPLLLLSGSLPVVSDEDK